LGGWEKLQLEEIRHGCQLEDHWDYHDLIAGHDFWSPENQLRSQERFTSPNLCFVPSQTTCPATEMVYMLPTTISNNFSLNPACADTSTPFMLGKCPTIILMGCLSETCQDDS